MMDEYWSWKEIEERERECDYAVLARLYQRLLPCLPFPRCLSPFCSPSPFPFILTFFSSFPHFIHSATLHTMSQASHLLPTLLTPFSTLTFPSSYPLPPASLPFQFDSSSPFSSSSPALNNQANVTGIMRGYGKAVGRSGKSNMKTKRDGGNNEWNGWEWGRKTWKLSKRENWWCHEKNRYWKTTEISDKGRWVRVLAGDKIKGM